MKVVHTFIFALLSLCVLYALYSGVFGLVTRWTYVSVALVVIEGVVLAASGGRCPLTLPAESLGARDGTVSDIFLPKWLADRIFPLCGSAFLIACVLLVVRVAA